MAIRRAGSFTATIKTPDDPANYSAIKVTFSQNGSEIIDRDYGDAGISIVDDTVVVSLSQNDTLLFTPPVGREPAYALMQIRCYKSTYDAPASKVWAIEVFDSLNLEVLS